MTPLELWEKAFVLVSNKDTWTQNDYARDKSNIGCWPHDERACKWCSFGAIYKANEMLSCSVFEAEASEVFGALASVAPMGLVATYNDTHIHEEVVEMWLKAKTILEDQL